MTNNLIQLLVGLPVVILLAYVSLKTAQKYMRRLGDGRYLQVKETVQVFNRAAVSIVKIGDEYHVMGVTDSQVTSLKVLSEAEARAFEAASVRDLRGMLKS